MLTAPELKHALQQYAAQLGFAACGVADPSAAAAEAPRLQAWIDAGYAAQMNYMHRKPQARCDARSLLPECRSVIVTALEWRCLEPRAAMRDGGMLARFAQGEDYHRVIHARLKQLTAKLDQLSPGQRHKLTVDSSPVLEKAYAVAAGIGWQGKHSIVLNARLGSSFMLGLILTTAELPADAPVVNMCGACERCIQACPTSALVAPAVLDARRCISNWTNAKPEVRPAGFDLRGWAYGCDLCQEACPYNAGALARWPVN